MGKADFLTIKNILNSTGASIISNDGALKVEGSLSATLSQDYGSGEIGSATIRTVQATDAISSVNVTNTVTVAPIAARGSRATAYASITADAETTVVAGVASTYLDLVYVMAANQSDAAITLDFACGASGATVLSLEIPANATAGVAPATAVPMPEVAQQWVVRFADSDTTGTTVDITALFAKET